MKSPEEKLRDKQRKNLKIIHNSLFAAFSFGQIKTWTDFYKKLGQSITDDRTITYKEIKEYAKQREEELERSFVGKSLPVEVEICKKSPTTNEPIPTIPSPTLFNVSGKLQQVEKKAEPVELTFESSNNYGLTPSIHEKVFYYWHQKKAIAESIHKIIDKHYPCILILAGTGTGKTFIWGGIARRLEDMKWYVGKTYSHMPIVYVGKSTILEQISRSIARYFGFRPNVDHEVINIEALRSSAGQFWVKKQLRIEHGEEIEDWIWKKGVHPAALCLDESQGVKRPRSTQSQIFHSYTEIDPDKRCLICMSATPFARVCEAQVFAVGTNRDISHLGFPKGTRLTNETWPSYARIIAAPASPEDYDEEAVKRLRKDLDDYIVQVKGVRPQFEADNGTETIHFKSIEQAKWYHEAYKRYLMEKAKMDALKDTGQRINLCYLVIRLKFAMAAEFLHAEHFADSMEEDRRNGFAPVTAVKFKQTVIEIVSILINKHHWKRSDISLIWGGGQTQLTKKQKTKNKIKDLEEELKKAGVEIDEILKDAGLDEIEDRVLKDYPSWLKLGLQSQEERQSEIDKFQSGKTVGCIYTLKAGGVGLSLPHTDDLTDRWNESVPGYSEWRKMIDEWNAKRKENERVAPGKCRRKESGYVYEEDVKFIPTRPRTTRVCVTDNAIELAQGVGRVPRIVSLSVTKQRVFCFAGTVEMKIAQVYSMKFRCLGALVRQEEDWQKFIYGGYKSEEELEQELQKELEKTKKMDNDESTLIDEGDDEQENGNGDK